MTVRSELNIKATQLTDTNLQMLDPRVLSTPLRVSGISIKPAFDAILSSKAVTKKSADGHTSHENPLLERIKMHCCQKNKTPYGSYM